LEDTETFVPLMMGGLGYGVSRMNNISFGLPALYFLLISSALVETWVRELVGRFIHL
jgi:hypothetical protein